LRADHVKCLYCGKELFIPIGEDKCPSCDKEGFLTWVNEEEQEVEVDEYRI
jgi:uncharacterized Zn finger protein (UPF0148 family)